MEELSKLEKKAILLKRAKKLAEIDHSTSDIVGEVIHLVKFSIGNELYGIETDYIHEILSVKEITRLPGVPSFVEGIINVRGQIMSVFNSYEIFQIKNNELKRSDKIIILSSINHQIQFGISVDMIHGTTDFALNEMRPIPLNLLGNGASYIRGISSGGIIILDALEMLNTPKLIINQ